MKSAISRRLDPGIISTYAPVVRFHENEQMFPCSIEWLLDSSTLKSHSDPGLSITSPAQRDLQIHSGEAVFVDVNPSRYGGEASPSVGVTAPMYYAVQQYGDAIEISYVMLYAFQDGQTIRALPFDNEFDCILRTVGMHQGDLERVVVGLVATGAGDFEVSRVGYEAHGDVRYYPPGELAWEGSHPVVNPALGGHGNHSLRVEGERIVDEEVPLVVAITSNVNDGGLSWRPEVFKQLGLDVSGAPVSEQVWAAFDGRLGVEQSNDVESATHFDGSRLSCFEWAYVDSVGTIAEILGLLPPSAVEGNGARGPAGRPWVRQPVAGERRGPFDS
jgi:hypothetical protein